MKRLNDDDNPIMYVVFVLWLIGSLWLLFNPPAWIATRHESATAARTDRSK